MIEIQRNEASRETVEVIQDTYNILIWPGSEITLISMPTHTGICSVIRIRNPQ